MRRGPLRAVGVAVAAVAMAALVPAAAPATAAPSGAEVVRQAAAPKPKESDTPDYFGELTRDRTCQSRPHVTAPPAAGKAAGHCVPVSAFGAFYEVTSPTEGASWKCYVPIIQGACGKETTNSAIASATEQALGTQFGFVWAMYQAVVNLAAWFTQWGVGFQPLAVVSKLAMDLQHAWQQQVIDPLHIGGFGGFVLLLAAVWAGLLMLFRRFRRGLAELMVAVLIAAIGAAFLTHPGTTISKSIDTARYFGLTVALVSLDPGGSHRVPTSPGAADRAAGQAVGDAVADKLVTSVMVKPHMIANTGRVQTGACGRLYWEMLDAKGSAKQQAYDRFTKQPGCVAAGALRPTVERIVMATLLLIMAIVIGVFCLLAVGLLLLSQLAAAAYLAVAGLVWAIAPLPGWGRTMLARWLTGLLVCIAGTVAGILVVVVYLDVLGVILGLGAAPLVNFTLALVVALVGLRMRKKLTSGLRNSARRIGARLEGTLSRPGETLAESEQRRHVGLTPSPVAAAVAGGATPGSSMATLAGGTVRAVGLLAAGASAGAAGAAVAEGGRKVGFGARVRGAVGQSEPGQLALSTAAGAQRTDGPAVRRTGTVRAVNTAAGRSVDRPGTAGAAPLAGSPGRTAPVVPGAPTVPRVPAAAVTAPGVVGAAQSARAVRSGAGQAQVVVTEATTPAGAPPRVNGNGSTPARPLDAGMTTAAGQKATRVAARVSAGQRTASPAGADSAQRVHGLIAELERRRARDAAWRTDLPR